MKDQENKLVIGKVSDTILAQQIQIEVDKIIKEFDGKPEMRESHTKEQQKVIDNRNQLITKYRSQLAVEVLDEYKIIKKKSSSLSRKGRDTIESYVNRLRLTGMLTQDELNYLED